MFVKGSALITLAICYCAIGLSPAFADTMSLDYGDFYGHLKKLDTEDTPALQFAFGFLHVETKQLCNVTSVNIVTQKQTIDVEVTNENRFKLATEKALKQARAIVKVTLQENTHQCDMSVQLETTPEYLKTQYSSAELFELYNQYVTFFDDMGGIFSFLMPSVSGLTLHFSEKVSPETVISKQASAELTVSDHKITIGKSWFSPSNALSLPQSPMRITATTDK